MRIGCYTDKVYKINKGGRQKQSPIYLQLDHLLSTFGNKCIFPPLKNLKKSKKKKLVLVKHMSAAMCKMLATPPKMSAKPHIMLAPPSKNLK